MLKLRKITKEYPHAGTILRNVDLEIGEGQTVVIAGPTGSGKTTLLRVMRGDVAPDSGVITFDGRELSSLTPLSRRMLKQVVALAEQEPLLIGERTVRENVALPLRLRGVRGSVLNDRIEGALSLLGLKELERVPVEVLSTGERKLVSIARALVQAPRILLLDEPLSGLDPHTSEAVLKRVAGLKAREGFALVVATHDPMVMARLKVDMAYRLMDGELARVRDPRMLFLFDGRLA